MEMIFLNNKKLNLKYLLIASGFAAVLIIVLLSSYYLAKQSFNADKTLDRDNKDETVQPLTSKPSVETPKPSAAIPKPPEKKEILLSFAGDCTIGTDTSWGNGYTLPSVLKSHNNDYSYFFKNVLPVFSNDNLTVVNLETTFTNSEDKLIKGKAGENGSTWFNFKGSPDYAKILTAGSVEVVNLSNNHIYDYKQKGFDDTIAALKSENVNYFGEGNKCVTEIKGIKFGFLGYTGYTYDNNFLSKVKSDIDSLKNENCIVVVTFHWGIERAYKPNETQQYLAHYAVDNGADLIIGHHPHVVQSLENYKGKIICYSLGNFCFGGSNNPSDKDTFIFQADYKFTDNNLEDFSIKVLPCSISSVSNINDFCPTPLNDARMDNIYKKLDDLSPKLGFKLTNEFTSVK